MTFSDKKYKTLGDVLKGYSITYKKESLFEGSTLKEASNMLKEELEFSFKYIAYKVSEEAICENILNPILREVWKPYLNYFAFWSHTGIEYDKELKGTPDYLITKLSPLGHIVFEQPYIAVVEAKLDDFIGGWVQCSLEMLAMQKINNMFDLPIYGIVSNGDNWELAILQGNIFTESKNKYNLSQLSELLGVLTYVLEECKRVYIDREVK